VDHVLIHHGSAGSKNETDRMQKSLEEIKAMLREVGIADHAEARSR